MIDLLYKTVLTIMNKDNQGYVSPTEFNHLANQVQYEIFRDYFVEENTEQNKENRGLVNSGYSNLSFNKRQLIQQFAETKEIGSVSLNSKNVFKLPDDLYFIEDNGVSVLSNGRVIDEVERSSANHLKKSLAASTAIFPTYERFASHILVTPNSVESIELKYLRKPKMPNWTYYVITQQDGTKVELYNPADEAFQDFELHISEFSNIAVRLLSYFGINMREGEIAQIAEILKDKLTVKESK